MASYHLHVRIISRSAGRSGVAAAAYRSCSKLKDERQGQTFDYTKKKDCAYSEILAPDNAPKWMYDREKLWNHIELLETRKNSQIARDLEIALPRELTLEQNTDLIREYVQQNFVSMGMVADLNIHNKRNNPHAHIMLTMRRIKGDGFGMKNEARQWNAKHLTLKWRKAWAEIHNEHMAKHGFDIRIDHRSYKAQGINIIPQIKLGITAHNKNPELDRVAEYKRIAFENGQRIIAQPDIALNAMSLMQATFTYDDIIRYVHAHSDESQFYDAVKAIEQSPELILIKEADYSRYNRYTTRTMQRMEQQMLFDASELSARKSHTIPAEIVDQAIINHRLSPEQATALRQAVNGGDLHVIIGHAGTGKTYTMGAMREVYEAMGYQMQGAALSAVAAKGLERDTGIPSTSIAKKLYQWENGSNQLNEKTVLIVDEAGMVGTRQTQSLIAEAKRVGAKTISIGDMKQTQAVESGGAFRGLCEVAKPSRLKQVWRQKEDWQIEATHLFSGDEKQIAHGIDMYRKHGMVHGHDTYNEAASAMLTEYVKNYSKDQSAFMCTFKNEHADQLNQLCRHHLKQRTDHIGRTEYEINTTGGVKLFAKGDRILFLVNDTGMGVDNGTFGTVKRITKSGCMEVDLGDGHTVAFDTREYGDITYGYAATVHKLQGATVDKCYVLAAEGFDRHLAYVAMSRHRHEMHLYWSKDTYENLEHLKRRFSSLGEKELIKDFTDVDSPVETRLKQLTRHDATFTEEQLEAVRSRLDRPYQEELMDQVVVVGEDAEGGLRYTTRAMIAAEERLFKSAETLGRRSTHAQGKLFIDSFTEDMVSDELRRFAVNKTLGGADLSIIETRHQIDKTYLAKMMAQFYKRSGYAVDAVTLSGAGADNFEKATGIQSATTFKRLWEFETGKNLLSNRSVLFVDNANMIGTQVMEQLLAAVEQANAKVILLGDQQLAQSVGAGGAYRGIIERNRANYARVDREKSVFDWQDHAKQLLRQDQVAAGKAIDMYAAEGLVHKVGGDDLVKSVVDGWLRGVQDRQTYQANMMLTYRNADVRKLNELARDRLEDLGFLDRSAEITVENYEGKETSFAAGDRVMFLRKDADLGVQGGALGSVRRTGKDFLEVRLDDGARIEVDTKIYNDLAHGYAANIYKAANMRLANTYIMATQQIDKQILAAALEVHTKSTQIYHCFGSYKKFQQQASLPRDKALVADYPMAQTAYKVTVKMPMRQPETTFVLVEAQVNQAHMRQELDRKARKFVQQCVSKARLAPELVKEVQAKVEEVPLEHVPEHLKAKGREKGRDHGMEF